MTLRELATYLARIDAARGHWLARQGPEELHARHGLAQERTALLNALIEDGYLDSDTLREWLRLYTPDPRVNVGPEELRDLGQAGKAARDAQAMAEMTTLATEAHHAADLRCTKDPWYQRTLDRLGISGRAPADSLPPPPDVDLRYDPRDDPRAATPMVEDRSKSSVEVDNG